MFNPVSLVVCLLVSQALPAFSYAVNGRAAGVISGLLERPHGPGRRAIEARQAGTCNIGYNACSSFEGCCRTGTVCGFWGGKPGCCPTGQNCVANDNPCIYQGDVPCANEDFCCPRGDTCFRDANGNPRCSSLGTSSIFESSTRPAPGPSTSVNVPPPPPPTQTTVVVTQTTGLGGTGVVGGTTPTVRTTITTQATGGLPTSTGGISNPLGNSATSMSPSATFCLALTGLFVSIFML